MYRTVPTIREYMTPTPHTLGVEQTLERAHAMLKEHGVRHLPVLRGGRLAGILSQRDLALIETLRDVDPARVSVEEAMTQDVCIVTPDAPLHEVAAQMAERRHGCVVVLNADKVVGIFTTVDACMALSEVLRGSSRPTKAQRT